jgi:hypothetical protein
MEQVFKTSFHVKTTIKELGNGRRHNATMLLDTGATACFINKDFANKLGLRLRPLPKPIECRNADGTLNLGGRIDSEVQVFLEIGDHEKNSGSCASNLGKPKMQSLDYCS